MCRWVFWQRPRQDGAGEARPVQVPRVLVVGWLREQETGRPKGDGGSSRREWRRVVASSKTELVKRQTRLSVVERPGTVKQWF